MDGESSTRLFEKKKKSFRDLRKSGEMAFVNRGKPVSEKWKPVWIWLQSLGRTKIVDSTEVSAWLQSNAAYAAQLKQFHSHGVLVHYVQKCHQRLLHGQNYKKEAKKKPPEQRASSNDARLPNNGQLSQGSRARSKSSEEKWQDKHHQLHWSEQQLVQNLLPPPNATKHNSEEEPGPDPDADKKWREQWRVQVLDNEKSTAEKVDDVNAALDAQVEITSPYPKRVKRPRSFYSPERKFDYSSLHSSKESKALDKVDALTKFELILQLEVRLREALSRCKGQTCDAHETGEEVKHAQHSGKVNVG